MIIVNRRFDLREHFGSVCARAMALALESDLRTMIYNRLKEEQLSAIEKFVSGQDVFVSLPTGFRKSVIYRLVPTIFDRLKGRLGRDTAPTSFTTACYNINSLHLTIKTCGCEIITLTPCNEHGRNQHCIAKLPDPFLCGVAQ